MKVKSGEVKAKLRSLIAPVIILMIILVGVFVIMFWQEEEEPIELIKVNAFEGEKEDIILENEQLKFVMNSSTTQFSLTVKSNGMVWHSNPQDAAQDAVALPVEKAKLQSTLLLTYSTINGVDTLYNNYNYSIQDGIYEIETNENSIRVNYSIGDVDKEYVVPKVIVADKMEALLEKMSNAESIMVKDYYKKYDINKLGKKDNREELLASYPILEEEIVYILRDTTKDNLKQKFEEYFERAGYTYEDFAEDKQLDLSESSSEKPVFNVSMVYRLEGQDLIVEVPMEDIEYKEEYPLLYLDVLPFFGAGGADEEGYMLVPEGGGAIIQFNNGKTEQNSYYSAVYGWDMTQGRSYIVHETKNYYGAFGIAKNDSSFVCIIENGSPYAYISADISGKNNSYNYVSTVYNILHREQYDVADKYNGEMFGYELSLPKENLTQRYSFTDSADYVDMAECYREYLVNNINKEWILNEDESTPVVIEVINAVDKVKQVFGIPVSKPLALTTYKETIDILQQIKESNVENISVKLSGWMNGGINQKILKNVKLISDLGGKRAFKDLVAYTNDNDIDLYLDGVTNYAYDSNIFNGFLLPRDTAKLVSKENVELRPYSKVWYGERERQDPYYLLRPSVINNMMQNLADYAQKNKVQGVSFRDVGMELSADYNQRKHTSRQSTLNMQVEKLKELQDSGTRIMVNMGNDYGIGYYDMVTNMDLNGSEYTIIDYTIPFYQMAIHGYVNYSGEALNLARDYQEELLKSAEYGAGLYFCFMNADSTELQNTLYTQYYGADFGAWYDKMLTIYGKYEEELGHTYKQRMTYHEYVSPNVTCTVYEDGTKVFVNYGYEDYAFEKGFSIPARDYLVIR